MFQELWKIHGRKKKFTSVKKKEFEQNILSFERKREKWKFVKELRELEKIRNLKKRFNNRNFKI